jgi:hypothetical protein
LVGTKEFVVEFWDNTEWKLGLQNLALKRKNGQFELKAPTTKQVDGTSYSTIMHEITVEHEIAKLIGVPLTTTLEKDLRENGYTPRATIHTIRTTYHKDGFIIDLDQATFPLLKDNSDYTYEIAEIELQVTDPSETQAAHEKIGTFAKKFGLTLANTRGKHMEFIYQNYPKHYQNLVKAGIMDK